MNKILKNKKILVTAGPTWVAIDKVRVITNIFSGKLGLIIAETAQKMGADVVFMLGPGRISVPENKKIKILRFRYFDDLLNLVNKNIKPGRFDAIIHSAAVSDYMPLPSKEKKIKSGKKNLIIRFKPTIKIVDLIRKIDPKTFLVKFKLEVGLSEKELIDIAYNSMLQSNADLMVANDFEMAAVEEKDHKAFIINPKKNIQIVKGKENIALNLLKILVSKI